MVFHYRVGPADSAACGLEVDWLRSRAQRRFYVIDRVEYYTNGLYLLAQTLTLGLWVPQSVEWWCQDATWQDEDDGELLSLDDEFPGQED